MDILKTVQNEKDFRFALWSKDFSLNNIKFLFNLLCKSLQFDYKNLPKRYFKKGDTVELTLLNNEDIKKLYFTYECEKEESGIQKILLTNDDTHGAIKFSLRASEHIWRLNKCSNRNQRLTSNKQLKMYNLLNLDTNDENPIRILSSEADIPYENFNYFERTSILLITQSSQKMIEGLREWQYHNHTFFDYFPAYLFSGTEKYKKINSGKNDRSEPERILNIFSDLAKLLDFINSGKEDRNFFIISDSYSRLFNTKTQQYFLQTLLNTNFGIKLLYFGNLNDFKRMNREDNIILTNKYIKPTIINSNTNILKNLKGKIQMMGDSVSNGLITESLNYSKRKMNINPKFANELKRVIFGLCSLNKYETEIFKNLFDRFVTEYKSEPVTNEIKVLRKNIENNNYKQITHPDNSFLVTDIVNKTTKTILGRNDFKRIISNNKDENNFIICFFSPDFFNDFLFPAIFLGYMNTNMISFRFYRMESKVFNFTLRNFLEKYKEFIGGAEFDNEIYGEDSEVSKEDVRLFEFNFSHLTLMPKENVKTVDAIIVELEDDKKEYVAFFSRNYLPTIVTYDSIFDTKLGRLEIGDEILFLPGVRNVFHEFSKIFENREIAIDLKDKWKDALREFVETNSFRTLIIQLRRFGINRTESTVNNWINNDSVIGTLSPLEDFQKIAKATNNSFLKQNYKQVADVCITLQRISKILGKKIKRLSISALRETTASSILEEYEPEIQKRVEEIINGMKIVTVTNINKQYRELDYSLINQLLEKDKIMERYI